MKNPIKFLISKFKKPLPPGARKISGIISGIRACKVDEQFYVVNFHVGVLRFSSVYAAWWAKDGDLVDVIYTKGWEEGTYTATNITNYHGELYRGWLNLTKRVFGILFSLLCVTIMSAIVVGFAFGLFENIQTFDKIAYYLLFFVFFAYFYGVWVKIAYEKFSIFFRFMRHKIELNKTTKTKNFPFSPRRKKVKF